MCVCCLNIYLPFFLAEQKICAELFKCTREAVHQDWVSLF